MWRALCLVALLFASMVTDSAAFTYHDYASAVRSGDQVACRWVRLAVDRWYRDLDRQGSAAFAYVFDETRAQRYIAFAQQLSHTQGFTGQIGLEPWQQFAWANVFGWVHRDTGLRRFRKVYREVARKNGKTVEGAAMVNAAWHLDGEIGAEGFFLAVDRNQARKAYDEAVRQNAGHPYLAARVHSYVSSNRTVKLSDPAAFLTPVSKDHKSQDSWNPHVILVDEYHAHRTNDLISVYESGMAARRQPLSVVITTAGTNFQGPAYQEERDTITKILGGVLENEQIWGAIYTLDDGDRWDDPAVWPKANPNLGVSVYHDYLEARVAEAKGSPRKKSDVLTKNLNVWQATESRWMDHKVWRRGSAPVDEAVLAQRPGGVCGGLDLSATTDITAWCLAFPADETGRHALVWRFFIPGDNLVDRIERDRVPYDQWIREGWIVPTDGDTVDYQTVLDAIRQDVHRFGVRSIGYDPWHAGEFEDELGGYVEMVRYYQRYSGMASPSQQFERLVLDSKIAHGDNPVAAWMIDNVELKTDRQGNFMPMKPRRDAYGKRIDGVVAAIMALHQVQQSDANRSVYAERGIVSL